MAAEHVSAIYPFVKRAGVALAAVVLVWLAVGGALAQDPPDKEDSKVSPLLRELLASAQEPVAAAQQSEAADADRGVAREARADSAGSKSAPPADEPQDELIRVDAAGNVQVYLYMHSTSEEALAELRELGARIEIVNARWRVIQAWIPTAARTTSRPSMSLMKSRCPTTRSRGPARRPPKGTRSTAPIWCARGASSAASVSRWA